MVKKLRGPAPAPEVNLDRIQIDGLHKRVAILESERRLLIQLVLKLGGYRGSDTHLPGQ